MGTTMPVTTVDEDGQLSPRESDVRFAESFFVMEPVSFHSGMPKGFSEAELRFGVLTPDPAHGIGRPLVDRMRGPSVPDVLLFPFILRGQALRLFDDDPSELSVEVLLGFDQAALFLQ